MMPLLTDKAVFGTTEFSQIKAPHNAGAFLFNQPLKLRKYPSYELCLEFPHQKS